MLDNHSPVSHDSGFSPIYFGEYSIKIADSIAEIEEAQRLRYHVFYETMGATPSAQAAKEKRDMDAYDEHCDHLLVRFHNDASDQARIVGTYRLLRYAPMQRIGQFYSESEYDLSLLKAHSTQLMELGRSCTHPDYRSKIAMQLLWRGIGEYVMHYGIEYMFGCASFAGCDPIPHADALTYLATHHLAPAHIRPRTLPNFYTPMQTVPTDTLNVKKIFLSLPPLIKGYLRLGGVVGDGAFLDTAFDSTDILMLVKTSGVSDKYVAKFSPDSVRGASE
jgi:putative hemolysin